jgi:TonB family protein
MTQNRSEVNMANQVLTPPELEPRDEVREPFHVSEVVDEPVWKTIAGNIRELFHPVKLPPLELTSTPIAVADPFAVKRDPLSSGVSIGVHIIIVALIAWFIYMAHLHMKPIKVAQVVTPVDVQPFMPIAPKAQAMGGGGGGGSHDILQTPKGKLPKIEKVPIVPPMVINNPHPKLAVDPAINLPKDITIPNTNMPNLGDPRSRIVGPESNGTGSGAGMGTGSNGGIGSGNGNGYGPGSGGGTGGGVYKVGGGVTAPIPINAPEPEFSDEARRAKYQGIVIVTLIVDAQGNPQQVKVERPLGMGLDEKAIEAAKQYRFKPATYQGKPVPVRIGLEINFHIY